jgi:hypothetical protein
MKQIYKISYALFSSDKNISVKVFNYEVLSETKKHYIIEGVNGKKHINKLDIKKIQTLHQETPMFFIYYSFVENEADIDPQIISTTNHVKKLINTWREKIVDLEKTIESDIIKE